MRPLISCCTLLLAFAWLHVGAAGKTPEQQALTHNTMLYLQFGRETCENCPELKAMLQAEVMRIFNHLTPNDYLECKFMIGDATAPFLITSTPDFKQTIAHRPWPWIAGVDDDLPEIQGPIMVSWALGGKIDHSGLDYFPFRKRMLLQ
jgi:hypothetical protein